MRFTDGISHFEFISGNYWCVLYNYPLCITARIEYLFVFLPYYVIFFFFGGEKKDISDEFITIIFFLPHSRVCFRFNRRLPSSEI